MPTTQTANAPSFESVWAILDRISALQEETDRKMKETDRKIE
jgi:hypothetical protein